MAARTGSVTFTYTVEDEGGDTATGTVVLKPLVLSTPLDQEWVVHEDSLSFRVLSEATQLNGMYEVEIVQAPTQGKLFQANFTQASEIHGSQSFPQHTPT